jgi:hypothetical protein
MSDEPQIPEWATTLPEPLQASPYLKGSDTPEAFVEQITNAAAHMGNSIRIPGPDADDAANLEFRNKAIERIPGLMHTPDPEDGDAVKAILGRLGTPESADSYRLPEGVNIEGEALGSLKAQAHAVGLTQSQFESQVKAMHEGQTAAETERLNNLAAGRETLRQEWGGAFNERMGEIAGFLKSDKDTPPDIVTAFDSDNLDATALRWLHKMSLLGEESSQVAGQERAHTVTATEAMEQLAEVEKRIFAPGAASDPMYQTWVSKRNELMLLAYPDSVTSIDSMRA